MRLKVPKRLQDWIKKSRGLGHLALKTDQFQIIEAGLPYKPLCVCATPDGIPTIQTISPLHPLIMLLALCVKYEPL